MPDDASSSGGGCGEGGCWLAKRAGRVPSFAVGRATLRVREVAAVLLVARDTVFAMCRAGSFPSAYLEADEWRIPVADVEAYQAGRAAATRRELAGRTDGG